MKIDSFASQFGPWALIAGASKGLGAEYATKLAGKGLNLVLVARQADLLQSLAKNLTNRFGIQTRIIILDLAAEDAAEQLTDRVKDLEIGLLVYNAALAPIARFFDLSLEQHQQMMATNMRTPLSLVYALGGAMRTRHKGGIILMSSLSAMQGSALISHYAATKAYNLILGEGLWDELSREGISVLVCMPASIATSNYLDDLPEGKSSPTAALTPEQVVRETLLALGKQSVVIPGLSNRLSAFVMRHILPRQWAVRLMGRVLGNMYLKK